MVYAHKAVYLVLRDAYLKNEIEFSDPIFVRSDILHWARMNHLERFDTDLWLCRDILELHNILHTYHFDIAEINIGDIKYPVVISLSEADLNKGKLRFKIDAIQHFDET